MIEKRYAILLAVTIILVFFIGFLLGSSYPYKFSLKALGTTGNVETPESNTSIPNEPLSFVSASCTVSDGVDVLKFRIQTGATGFGQGEISAYLDNILVNFKDSNGNSINSMALAADSVSNEFSFTTTSHQASRKITVAIPTGSFDKILTCS